MNNGGDWAKWLIQQYVSQQEFDKICSGFGLDERDREVALRMLEHWHPECDWDDLTNLAKNFVGIDNIGKIAEKVVALAAKAAQYSSSTGENATI
jgi:hypothetical protein